MIDDGPQIVRRVAARTGVGVLLMSFLVMSFLGCSGGHAPVRGFGSRQLLATRDPSFQVVEQDDDELIASSSVDGGTLYSSINVTTGQVENLGPSPTFFQAPADAGATRFTCATATSSSGDTVLTITDAQSGQSTSIDGFAQSFPSCPADESQVLVVERIDSARAITLWSGPYDRLAQFATDLDIQSIVSFDSATITMLAARTIAPSALGIYAVDVATLTAREIVAPVLGAAAYADGAPQGAALASASLSKALPVWGLGDHFFYARVMAGGESVIFVGPFASGPAAELALVPVPSRSAFARPAPIVGFGPAGTFASPGTGPAFVGTGTMGNVLRYWDDGARRLVSCDLPLVTVPLIWSTTPNGRQILFDVDREADTAFGAAGPLLLVSLDRAALGTACSLLAKQDVTSSGFSPSGTSMFWVTAPSVGNATLSTAAADGTAARTLGAGISIDHVHFLDDARLELTLYQDLVWLDASEPAPPLHYIAEQVFGDSIDFSGGSIVTGYEFNEQDGTGQLGVVDRDTGLKTPISPSVVSYEGFALPTVDGGVTQQIGIAYIVRGRYPSPQDGLWWATIDLADLR
jgi:hypothetical protein